MPSRRRVRFRTFAILAAATLLSSASLAETYPSRPVDMIINFPPGGVTDLVGRILAQEMHQSLGQPMVVINKEGGGGIIGASAIANAAHNGYETGFIAVAAVVSLPHMRAVKYSLDSFDYICQAFDVPFFILVNKDSPYKSLPELITAIRKDPNKLKYGTVGPGTLPHLTALDLMRAAGVKAAHVPFAGEGPAVTALLGNHIDFYVGTSAALKTFDLRPLGVAATEPAPGYPDVPTLKQSGYDVVWSVAGGLIAPEGIPEVAKASLQKACQTAVSTEAYQEKLNAINVTSLFVDGPAFKEKLQAEFQKNKALLEEAGLLKK